MLRGVGHRGLTSMGHQHKTMVGALKKPGQLVGIAWILNHQIIFQIQRDVCGLRHVEQVAHRRERQLAWIRQLKPMKLQPGLKQLHHLRKPVLADHIQMQLHMHSGQPRQTRGWAEL
jgi:hypothetical protein